MSRLLLLFLVLSSNISLFSQNWEDSIQQFHSDTAALEYLHQEFNKVIYSNPEVSSDIVILYDSVAQFSPNSKYQGQAKILNGNIFFTKGEHEKSLPYFIYAIKILDPLNEPNEQNIEIHSGIESMILDVDTMIPLGLVINALTSNALKHAFHSRDNENITITLREIDTQLHLSVKYDGMGAELFQLENKSFGFSLIKSFARRLNAKLALENNNGLFVELLVHNYQKAA